MADPEAIRQQRERLVNQIEQMGSLPASFKTTVVGVSFVPSYPMNLYKLEELYASVLFNGDEPIQCVLIRNPNNEHDPFAIEVHVPALGKDNGMIGHLTRPIAARLSKELDSGIRWQGRVWSLRIHPEHSDRPGIEVELTRKGRYG